MLGVIGIDDAVVLGLGGIALSYAAHYRHTKNRLLEKHGDRIEEENEREVETWRASRPRQRKISITRTFKQDFFSPAVDVTRKYRRDPRPWYQRWFS